MIKSICIVRLSALGDVLMAVPLIRTLQANLPQAKLTWIISKPAFDLVEGMDGVEFILIDKPNNIADYWRFKKQMKGRTFDVLLAPQASLRTNLLYPFIKAKRKIGYDEHRANDAHGLFVNERITPGLEHTLDGFLKFAQSLGIKERVIRWDLPITSADYEWAEQHLPKQGPILVVNPAASKPERSWPVARYIDVLRRAREKWNVQVIITGGPIDFDKHLADQITQVIPAINLVGKTKPKQLLALISKATVVLCPDTGPSHMATAVNTPVIALHAVTNPLISGPYLFQHLVVNHYPEAAEKILGSKRIEDVWGLHVHGDEPMQLIPVDEVMEKLSIILDGYKSTD
ncbi:ADP-heptose--LPS heptosyltransferase [Legionella qingyii]|uniref:ADP-heptose--LPS heptosyltransferase n=1 Tax=Legionella qingyii TaxID=2184757 RepID=A0A317U2I0_9GAMM|nr:glycosyltransferase family 9 protein [Legionella qingyii]PWY54692.1 ADP-heptose--LPS heptosyltransferase [Legionella qingyii]RUR20404.1 glycosyltransferase family 9 protein [Legionella qingyii]RUR29417.1 glycosyltransferase family 9 protein [Legionella qingyii]